MVQFSLRTTMDPTICQVQTIKYARRRSRKVRKKIGKQGPKGKKSFWNEIGSLLVGTSPVGSIAILLPATKVTQREQLLRAWKKSLLLLPAMCVVPELSTPSAFS